MVLADVACPSSRQSTLCLLPGPRGRLRDWVRQAVENQQTLIRNPAKGEQGSRRSPASGPAKPPCVGFPRCARDFASPTVASLNITLNRVVFMSFEPALLVSLGLLVGGASSRSAFRFEWSPVTTKVMVIEFGPFRARGRVRQVQSKRPTGVCVQRRKVSSRRIGGLAALFCRERDDPKGGS